MKNVRWNWSFKIAMAAASATLLGAGIPATAQRSLGIDVSAYQGNLSTTAWATLKRATNQQVGGVFGDGRDFVFIRSTRGGTTGEDHRQGGYPSGNNTFYDLSQRYDDPYYVQNISQATSAGLLAGTYHFARPDVLASTLNSDGVTTAGVDNSGTDEANHMIQMAGPWMRPGYLLPVLDLEAGNPARTATQLATFCTDFSAQIYAVMGIRPMIYVGGTYSSYLHSASNPAALVTAFPKLWNPRYVANGSPTNTTYLTGHPKDTYSGFYGPWSDPPNPANPWNFWQYGSQGGLNAYGGNLDKDVAQGGIEVVKDCLVPALWMNDMSGQWTTLLNWNSGQTPVAPVPGPNQLTPVGTQTLPTARLPDTNDTVILDRPSAAITVTLASGMQNIRKLYMRETLNITGGSLSINYVPSPDSTPIAAQFSGPVTLSGSASLSVHTLQVDATQTFTLGGGTLTFNTINLMPHSTTPAKILMSGDVNFNSLATATPAIANGAGSGSSGWLDLGGATRAFNIANGVDMLVNVPIANGALTKTGLGTMHLGANDSYAGDTVIGAGTLALDSGGSISNTAHIIVSNAATLNVTAKAAGFFLGGGQTLAGNGSVAGLVTVYGTVSPGASVGRLTFSTNLTLPGTTVMEVSRSASVLTNDAIICTSGTLTYGGTLVVTNTGPDPLANGDTFQLFNAVAYASAFSATNLPPLGSGLGWDTSGLGTGVAKVVYVGLGQPTFQSIAQSGPNVILRGTNGIAGTQYYLLSSTNVALPMTNWTRLLTNVYGAGGSFSNSVPMNPLEGARFYRLQRAN